MNHRTDRPDDQRPRITLLGAQPVNDPTGEQHRDRIRELKRHEDIGIVRIAPAELPLQIAFQQAQHLSIQVIDRRGKEEQTADGPPVFAYLCVDLV